MRDIYHTLSNSTKIGSLFKNNSDFLFYKKCITILFENYEMKPNSTQNKGY